MRLPNQSQPVVRGIYAPRPSFTNRIAPQGCSIWDKIKCVGEGTALLAGPCDPAGFPEDLITCIPAAALYVHNCEDCIAGTVKSAICDAVNLAQQHGVPIPQALLNFCS